MIKKITEKEYDWRDRKYLIMFLLGSIFFVLAMFSIFNLLLFRGSEILYLGIYGLPFIIAGLIKKYELDEQRDRPENFVYCKKCKKIIRKKHKFCCSCRNSIRRSLCDVENRKHFKDYKKFEGKKL